MTLKKISGWIILLVATAIILTMAYIQTGMQIFVLIKAVSLAVGLVTMALVGVSLIYSED